MKEGIQLIQLIWQTPVLNVERTRQFVTWRLSGEDVELQQLHISNPLTTT